MKKLIQMIVKEEMKGIKTRILFGTIESMDPLSVKVDQRFSLPEELLIVPESLQEVKLTTKDWKCSNDSNEEVTREYTLKQGLEVDDTVIIINLGQSYLILDRIGDPSEVISITE